MSNIESKSFSIYQSTANLERLYTVVEELEGEINEYIDNELALNKENIKVNSIDLLSIRGIASSQIDTIDKEIARLQELKEWRAKQVEKVEKVLFYILLKFGEQDKKGVYRLDLDTYKLSTKKNPNSVEIIDSQQVPFEFKKFDFTLKNLTNEDLGKLKAFLEGWNQVRLEENLEAIEFKEEMKISKTALKPKLEELEELLKGIDDKLNGPDMLSVEQREELLHQRDNLPNYYAEIKEGKLNLVIK